MDADTRHHLKQNEFAEFLGKIFDLNDKRTIGWLVVILAIALGYAGYKFWDWRQDVQLAKSYRELNAINASDATMGDGPLSDLRRIISSNSQPGLVAMARMQLARGLEVRGLEPGNSAKLDEALGEYNALLNMRNAPNSLRAAAVYRLGMVSESQRNFEAARKHYAQLTEEVRFKGSPFVDLADARLEMLGKLSEPVHFKAGARPLVSEPAPEPAFEGPVIGQPDPAMLPIAKQPKPADLPTEEVPPASEEPPPAPEPETDTDDGDPPATPSEPQQP